jgi:hypothetical protein
VLRAGRSDLVRTAVFNKQQYEQEGFLVSKKKSGLAVVVSAVNLWKGDEHTRFR